MSSHDFLKFADKKVSKVQSMHFGQLCASHAGDIMFSIIFWAFENVPSEVDNVI